MIIFGSCGKTGNMSQIFFGSTAEKVLRFITRPVLCIPPESDYRNGVNMRISAIRRNGLNIRQLRA
jgi:hypothetical protein